MLPFSRKKIFTLLVSILFFFALGEESAFAVVPVWDVGLSGSAPQMNMSTPSLTGAPGWFQSKEYFLTGLSFGDILTSIFNVSWDGISSYLMRAAMMGIREVLFTFIQSGWDGINMPYFIQDPSSFFDIVSDTAAGQFLEELQGQIGSGDFCREFAQNILDIIPRGGSWGGGSDYHGVKEFSFRARCSIDNLAGFYDDFSSGGWQNWNELRKTNNNPFGLFLMTMDAREAETQRASASRALESNWGNGYLPKQTCVGNDSNSPGCDRYKTHTPTKSIADRVDAIINSDIEDIVQADELTEVIVSVLTTVVQNAIQQGFN